MTAVLDELGLPVDGPIYFGDLVPFVGGIRKVTTERLAAYHAAECLAHFQVYNRALHAFVRFKPGDEPPVTMDTFQAAVRDHFGPAVTAWTAAAALRGWDGPRIGVVLDLGDRIEETAWEWLADWLSPPGDLIDDDGLADLIGRLTVEPQPKVHPRQMLLDFTGAPS